jgi:hypothetical protein
MRNVTLLLVLSALSACSSSSGGGGPEAGTEGGGAGDDAAQPADGGSPCPGKPESNHTGSCAFYGVAAADAGDAGAPLLFCTDYTGSSMTDAGAIGACNTSLGVLAASCPTTGVIGSCILSCGTPFETVQHYYTDAVVAQQQCGSTPANFWLAQ